MKAGTVHIVGAGAGDPELITVKALKLIRRADVILYDRLVDESLLSEAKPDAIVVYCGKSPGAHSMPQERIHEELIAHASLGREVVRLKGGDPFIFGRGGEEALALAERGIPYEVVPGVTAALAAASATDIPLTHRGVSASVAFVTASRCAGESSPVRWDSLSRGVDTLVIYMGVGQLERIRGELLAHGKPEHTPVAVVERGASERQRTLTTTLGLVHKQAAAMKLGNPSVIIVGECVNVRERLSRLACASKEAAV